ncbi:MAG: hypothetical protein JNK58_12930 [Phycisphaerae bacterium]|nr:hypothetical protein [Phycisphaerae bacterium]
MTRKNVIVLAMAAFCAATVGVIASATMAAGGGNVRCPEIWAPVICSNGVTYPNQCYADRARARGCVRTGDI